MAIVFMTHREDSGPGSGYGVLLNASSIQNLGIIQQGPSFYVQARQGPVGAYNVRGPFPTQDEAEQSLYDLADRIGEIVREDS